MSSPHLRRRLTKGFTVWKLDMRPTIHTHTEEKTNDCYADCFTFQIKKEEPIKSAILQYSRPLPCLCIQVKHQSTVNSYPCPKWKWTFNAYLQIPHRGGLMSQMPLESRSAPLKTVSHLIALGGMVPWSTLCADKLLSDMIVGCRPWGAVVWNFLWTAGRDIIVEARLPCHCCGWIVSEKRGWHVCGSAACLQERQQREGRSLPDRLKERWCLHCKLVKFLLLQIPVSQYEVQAIQYYTA